MCTPYKISTITATACINSMLNLDKLYECIELIDHTDISDGITFIEYGKKKENTFSKGYNKKLHIKKRKKESSKRFDNQATVILKKYHDNQDTPNYSNMKIFKNGNVQVTGLKTIDHGVTIILFLIEYLQNLHKKYGELLDTADEMHLSKYKICLINSDYRIGFEINRDSLNRVIQTKYNVFCNYEPCIYPGVKIQFSWNDESMQTGVCQCSKQCNGKGCGHGNGNCKKITIAVFQSGCIIITGAQSYAQINTAYNFINDIIEKNKEVVKKIDMPTNKCTHILKVNTTTTKTQTDIFQNLMNLQYGNFHQ